MTDAAHSAENDALRERVKQRLADLNADGWRLEAEHSCDGTERSCMENCPVPVQLRVSLDEITDAVVTALTHREQACVIPPDAEA